MADETCMAAIRAANAYLVDAERKNPFFVALDDGNEYSYFLQRFAGDRGIGCVGLDEFCNEEDSFPDLDWLFTCLQSANSEALLLLGVGDAVRLFDSELIGKLRDLVLHCKLLVPCRGARKVLREIAQVDPKFGLRQVVFASSGAYRPVEAYPPEFGVVAEHGIRNLLKALRRDGNEAIKVQTRRQLKGVRYIRSAYDAWTIANPSTPFPESILSSGQWKDLLLNGNLEGFPIDHWRTFMKFKKAVPEVDSYLAFVVGRTGCADEWRNELVRAILDVPLTDRRFRKFFDERKALLKALAVEEWNDAEGAEFVAFARRIDVNDRYAYFTDLTMPERKAIIESVSDRGTVPMDLVRNDPRLADYLHDFHFSGEDGDFWTDYFVRYKQCKVGNRIDEDFLALVETEAKCRDHFLKLPTRGNVLDRFKDGKSGLFWLDALGSEYLGYIQTRAREMGLSMKVTLVRANLPTLTCFNRDFYDDWPTGVPKMTSGELDDITHDGAKGFDYQTTKKPIHLAAELDAVESALQWINKQLKGRLTRRIILVSDHGASRLAVINESETKWAMGTKGEHSGRCCPKDEIGERPECATEEEASDGKTYWVLANYDRFKGGRKASVEVHGGASLEEVAIPLVVFSLGKAVKVDNLTPTLRLGTEGGIAIEIFSPDRLRKVSLDVAGRRYPGECQDSQGKIRIPIPEVKRPGIYEARVFEGDDEIGAVSFTVEGRAARIRRDDFF